MKLTFNKSVLLSKLADELYQSGLVQPLYDDGISSVQGTSEEVWIYVPDDTPQEDVDKIAAIVESHDPTPPPYQPTVEEQLMLALTDAQLKIAEQQELISNQQQLIDQLALAITDLQLQQGVLHNELQSLYLEISLPERVKDCGGS